MSIWIYKSKKLKVLNVIARREGMHIQHIDSICCTTWNFETSLCLTVRLCSLLYDQMPRRFSSLAATFGHEALSWCRRHKSENWKHDRSWHRRGILESIELKKSSSLAEWSPFAVFVSSYKLIRSIRVIDTAFHGACCSLSFWTFLNRSYAHWFARTSKWIRLSVPMPMWKNSCHWSVGLVFDALCKGRKARSQSVEAELPFAHLVRDQYVTGCQYSQWWTLQNCSKSTFLSGDSWHYVLYRFLLAWWGNIFEPDEPATPLAKDCIWSGMKPWWTIWAS